MRGALEGKIFWSDRGQKKTVREKGKTMKNQLKGGQFGTPASQAVSKSY